MRDGLGAQSLASEVFFSLGAFTDHVLQTLDRFAKMVV